MEVSIDKPRTVQKGVSVYRPNSGDAEQGIDNYYRINMFLPLLNGIVSHIRQRFGVDQRTSLALSRLIPAYLGIYRDIEPAVVKYANLVACKQQVEGEFLLWRQQWSDKEVSSAITTAAAAIERCSDISMPNIRALLVILATLPVTSAKAERVFC